ncbi:MAG TPA: hypothetical protein VGD08_09540 [Stellaceae bacterium]|jgi:hypothetical protein
MSAALLPHRRSRGIRTADAAVVAELLADAALSLAAAGVPAGRIAGEVVIRRSHRRMEADRPR